MGFLESILNLVLPLSAALAVVVLWPVLAFVKVVLAIASRVFYEDVRGKVVLITGASSGIGEHVAYEYAKRGARLALVARREALLHEVADRAMARGASDVKVIVGDVSHEHECQRFVDETIAKYGRLDHLVNNAGLAHSFFFTDTQDMKALTTTLDTSFWSYVYMTYYALPHLRRSCGKILVMASVASWIPYPREILYNAAKAGTLAFFDTLRVEEGDTIGITIVMPGWIQSGITEGKFMHADGQVRTDKTERDMHLGPVPMATATECARAAVKGAVRGSHYVIVPWYYSVFLLFRVFAPEVLEWVFRFVYVRNPQKPLSMSVLEVTHADKILYPSSIQKND